jgi:hypothetical protein
MTRTRDLLITNQLLYQLSYRGTEGRLYRVFEKCKRSKEDHAVATIEPVAGMFLPYGGTQLIVSKKELVMIKTLTTIAIATSLTTAANAAPLPAPPTEVYTPPVQSSCVDTTVQVYFENGASALTNHARSVISQAQQNLSGCALGDVEMIAITSDARTQDELVELSSERIAMVSGALASEGVPIAYAKTAIDTDIEEASTLRPMTRRVEVRLTAWAPEIG